MIKPCDCPLAGFCERHAIEKTEGWHNLCQTDESYRKAWDEYRGPGQFNLKPGPSDRVKEIKARVARDERLRNWVKFFRLPTEYGLGDTAQRLLKLAKSKELKADLDRILAICACKRSDAIQKLNDQYPYVFRRPTMDGSLFIMDKPPTVVVKTPSKSRAVVVVAPDEKPQAELAITGPLIKAYAEQCDADYIEVVQETNLNHGAANKYIATQIAKHYEQTLLIDTDIVPMPGAPNIFDAVPVGKWGMVDELPQIRTCKDATKWMEGEWANICKALGEHKELVVAWNSGLVVMPRDAELDYFPSPTAIPNTWCAEQHFLTHTLHGKVNRVCELPAIWQAGFPWADFETAIKTSHFVHVNGTQGAHKIRLAILRHFSTGYRSIPENLRNLVRKQPWVTRWARNTPNPWTVIHRHLGEAIGKPWDAKQEKRWYKREWIPTIPNNGCECKSHWRAITRKIPIDWTSAESAFKSLWELHNYVSEHHANKPTITLEQAKLMYIPNHTPQEKT